MSYIWVHEDAMRLDHPVFHAAGEAAKPIFIWNTQEHDARGYSLKRRVFIYECAQDLDIPIYAGSPRDILSALSGGEPIFAAGTPDPYIQTVLAEIGAYQEVVTIDTDYLTQIPANADMGRFFRFWNRAKKSALTASSDRDDSSDMMIKGIHNS